jgi:ATP synthase subunit G
MKFAKKGNETDNGLSDGTSVANCIALLAEAEKKAQHLVENARKKKNAQLRVAKEESAAELERFKKECETKLSNIKKQTSTDQDTVSHNFQKELQKRVSELNEMFKSNSKLTLESVISNITAVAVEPHHNHRV